MCLACPAGSLLAWGASWALCLSGGQCRAGGTLGLSSGRLVLERSWAAPRVRSGGAQEWL